MHCHGLQYQLHPVGSHQRRTHRGIPSPPLLHSPDVLSPHRRARRRARNVVNAPTVARHDTVTRCIIPSRASMAPKQSSSSSQSQSQTQCAKYQYVVTSSGPKIVPVPDVESKDEESAAEYNQGGYLPVKVKDTFKNDRYVVVRKLGCVFFSLLSLLSLSYRLTNYFLQLGPFLDRMASQGQRVSRAPRSSQVIRVRH